MPAAPLTATLLAQLRGGDAGDMDIRVTWNIPAPKETIREVTLPQNAASAIGIPSNATLVIVIPPATNTQTIRIDSASGKKLGSNIPFVIPVDGDTTLTLHLAAGSNQIIKIICI